MESLDRIVNAAISTIKNDGTMLHIFLAVSFWIGFIAELQ